MSSILDHSNLPKIILGMRLNTVSVADMQIYWLAYLTVHECESQFHFDYHYCTTKTSDSKAVSISSFIVAKIVGCFACCAFVHANFEVTKESSIGVSFELDCEKIATSSGLNG